jgi:hypothetical protein
VSAPLEFRAYRDGQHCLLRAWNAAHQSHDDASSRAYAALIHWRRCGWKPLWPDAADASEGGALADIAARTTALIAQGCPALWPWSSAAKVCA